jgi:AcrR family transcriptional regulator
VTADRLSRSTVLDATLALATEEGLPAVTMRAVARRLGVTPMALYRHVGDKQGLLDGLVERLLQEIPLPGTGLDWRQQLHDLGESIRAAARRHPDLFVLLFQRRAVTERAVAPRRAVYRALHDAGLPEEAIPLAERLLSTFMLGFAASEAGGRLAGVDADADMAAAERLIAELIASYAGHRSATGPRS